MKIGLLTCGLVASISSLASATALTYKLLANEKACFYTYVEQKGAKIAFYFAVSISSWDSYRTDRWLSVQVQSGGSFDVDYEVLGPNQKVILDGQKERQGDFVFTATESGEYRFCFNNEMSTFAEKFVDFEIAVRFEHVNPVGIYWQHYFRLKTSNVQQHSPRNKVPHLSKHPL
jgi:hypothetical protein